MSTIMLQGRAFDTGVDVLDLSDWPICDHDLALVGQCTALEELCLRGSDITNVMPLAELRALVTLDISSTSVRDLDPLAGLPALQVLVIENTEIEDLPALPTLYKLLAARSGFEELATLMHVNTLAMIDVSHITHLDSVSALANMPALVRLWIGNTGVTSLAPLAGAPRLLTLRAEWSAVADLGPVATMPALRLLDVAGLELELAPLAGHASLETIVVSPARVRDLRPLLGLPALRNVVLVDPDREDLERMTSLVAARPGVRVETGGAPIDGSTVAANHRPWERLAGDRARIHPPLGPTPITPDPAIEAAALTALAPRTPRPPRPRARHIAGYRLGAPIGEGPRACAYYAEHVLGPHRPCVLKLLDEIWHDDVKVRSQFLEAATVQQTMRHAGIAEILDVIDLPGQYAIVSATCNGGNLEAWLAERPWSEPDHIETASAIVLETLDALGFLHAAGVIHRNLKPSNVLFTGGHAVLADVGAAWDLLPKTSPLAAVIPFPSGARYASPELLRNRGPVGPASDVFAVGALFYEMIVGVPAFGGNDIYEIMEPIFVGPRAALFEAVSTPFDAVITQALDVEPERRYATCAEMAADIVSARSRLVSCGGPG